MANLVKILCKGGNDLYVSIRGDKVVLAHDDPNDRTQQWNSVATTLTDDSGQTAFALVNEGTRQVMVIKEKYNGTRHAQLAPYAEDERVLISMLWTMVWEVHGDGFHQLAMLRNSTEVLDAEGGNSEGTILGLFSSHYSYQHYVDTNQLWKFLPVSGSE
nr:unnamed protein product [Digitaria exilis]